MEAKDFHNKSLSIGDTVLYSSYTGHRLQLGRACLLKLEITNITKEGFVRMGKFLAKSPRHQIFKL